MYVWTHDGLMHFATLVCFQASDKLFLLLQLCLLHWKTKVWFLNVYMKKMFSHQFTKLAESLTTFELFLLISIDKYNHHPSSKKLLLAKGRHHYIKLQPNAARWWSAVLKDTITKHSHTQGSGNSEEEGEESLQEPVNQGVNHSES